MTCRAFVYEKVCGPVVEHARIINFALKALCAWVLRLAKKSNGFRISRRLLMTSQQFLALAQTSFSRYNVIRTRFDEPCWKLDSN